MGVYVDPCSVATRRGLHGGGGAAAYIAVAAARRTWRRQPAAETETGMCVFQTLLKAFFAAGLSKA